MQWEQSGWNSALGYLIAASVVISCADSAHEPEACFQVPVGAEVLVVARGEPSPGAPGIMSQQSETLQGEPPGIMQQQSETLQGEAGFMSNQGTVLQGLEGGSRTAPYRGLLDLNGARLAIAANPAQPVTLDHGQLVGGGFARTAALSGTPLVATTSDGRSVRIEIAAVTPGGLSGDAERVEIIADGIAVCEAAQHGVLVPGRFDGRGVYTADPDTVTYACMTGAIAKCVEWGYAPWRAGAEAHASCTRLARADYCGEGVPWTRNGTVVSAYDTLGIHASPASSRLVFEAAWGPGGAVCVARPRYAIENASGAAVLPGCFAQLPRCTSLAAASELGAQLANHSAVAAITACE